MLLESKGDYQFADVLNHNLKNLCDELRRLNQNLENVVHLAGEPSIDCGTAPAAGEPISEIDLKMKLHDDDTPFGGVSFAGETLENFLDEVGLPFEKHKSAINEKLRVCGISQLS